MTIIFYAVLGRSSINRRRRRMKHSNSVWCRLKPITHSMWRDLFFTAGEYPTCMHEGHICVLAISQWDKSFVIASNLWCCPWLHKVHSYTAHKNKCRRASQAKLQNVCDQFVLKLLFYAWLEDYKESRKARRWFSRETGPDGSGNDSDEEWYWTEGEDPISLLPREVAVKVRYL